MTEKEWLECADPQKMLVFLRDKASDRKLRLFSCACYRNILELLPDGRSRELLETCERLADGLITYNELWTVSCLIVNDKQIAWGLQEFDAWKGARITSFKSAALAAKRKERQHQARLMRCVFNHPSRPITCDPLSLPAIVTGIAQAIYDDRNFDSLPILADALEESGCTNSEIMAHCREPGPHVRGCWVVDAVLGKK